MIQVYPQAEDLGNLEIGEYDSISPLPEIIILETSEEVPPHPLKGIFEGEELISGINDKRSVGIVHYHNNTITTRKYKGSHPLISGDTLPPDPLMARILDGQPPGAITVESCRLQKERSDLLHNIMGNYPHISNPFETVVGYHSLEDSIPEDLSMQFDISTIYTLWTKNLSGIERMIIEINRDNPRHKRIFEAQLGQVVVDVNGYDIRTNQGPSFLKFPGDIDIYKDDPFFRRIRPEAVGGFTAGSRLIRQGLSHDDIVRRTYRLLSTSYDIDIPLPEETITEQNYCRLVNEIQSQVDIGRYILETFIDNNIPAIARAHAHGIRFNTAIDGEGGSLISRNIGWGTAEKGSINDTITAQKVDDITGELLEKDIREFITSLAGMSRLWSSDCWKGIVEYAKNKYFQTLFDNNLDTSSEIAFDSDYVEEMVREMQLS